MDRQCLFNGLDFNNDFIGDEQIHFVCRIQADAMVGQWHPNPPLDLQAKAFQVVTQAGFIRALKKPRSQGSVDLYRGTDDLTGEVPQWEIFPGTQP